MGDWKGVKYNVLKEPNKPLELYNLSNDIGEKNNVAEQFPEIVEQIEIILKKSRTDSKVFTFNHKNFSGLINKK